MEDLIGKKIIAFEFSGGPGFCEPMKKLIGQEGTITECNNEKRTFRVIFKSREEWSYPYPEILNHLVENSKSIEELLNEIKQLNSKLWNQKT